MEVYLQHGAGTQGPFKTERVAAKRTAMPRNPYRTGYGARVPTSLMVWFNGRWRRVYCAIYSNNGTTYIREKSKSGAAIIVRVYGD